MADMRYWIISIVLVVAFIGSESIIIFYMMTTIKQKIRLSHCFLYSFVGFFFSCITPSATGGQPAQIYYMKKDDIPISLATLILMIVTITYKLVLIVLGILVFILKPHIIMFYLKPVIGICYIGLALNIFTVAFMIILVFHPTLAKSILYTGLKLLGRMHFIKQTQYYLDKIELSMQQYSDVASYLINNKLVVFNAFLITLLQRFFLFFITYLTYKSFRLDGIGMPIIVTLQGMISVAVDMLPLPGGMGISEKLFMEIFTPLLGNITLPIMVVSRGLSYYTELILSAVITISTHFIIVKTTKGK